MSRKPLFIVWVITAVLAASWIAPPWLPRSHVERASLLQGHKFVMTPAFHEDRVWGLLFDPEMANRKIDFARLALLDALILSVGGAALLTVADQRRRLPNVTVLGGSASNMEE